MKNGYHLAMLLSTTLALISAMSCAPKQSTLTRVLVTGDANVQAAPDTAVLVLSIVTQSQRAVAAQQENARKTDEVIRAVKATAGANSEIRTSDYSLQPQYSYQDTRLPSIIGYESRNSVTVTISDLNSVGAVIDAASQAGANSVESVSFILRESNPARGQTLTEATRQAMNKAQAIAQALGGRVVRVIETQEGGPTYRPPITDEPLGYSANMNATANTRKSASTPVEAGTLNVRSQVQVIVEIEAQPRPAQ
jgi:uncharacterized protein YggE